jgi:putative transposase
MKKSKFSETQIVAILNQGDAGVPVKDLCRQAGISSATCTRRSPVISVSRTPRRIWASAW